MDSEKLGSSTSFTTAGASAAYDAAHFLKPHVARVALKSAGVDLMLDVGIQLVASVVEKPPIGFISDFINLLEVGEKAIGLLSSSSKNLAGVSQRAECGRQQALGFDEHVDLLA